MFVEPFTNKFYMDKSLGVHLYHDPINYWHAKIYKEDYPSYSYRTKNFRTKNQLIAYLNGDTN